MSERERIVIVGGGPAGLATAESYRANGGTGEVTLLAGESRPPYERPPLSKDYLRGESSSNELAMREPGWYRENRIDLKLGIAVRDVDTDAGEVAAANGRVWPFERCVLATGSHAAMPDIPGLDNPAVRTLRRVEDSERLAAETGPGVKVAVIGSGFIGCEIAVSLRARGADVAMLTDEEAPQAARLGTEAGRKIAAWLEEAGVDLRCGSALDSVEPGAEAAVLLRTADGTELEADLAVIALGAARNTALAETAGLEMRDGLVVADSSMQTSHERVLAAGDIALAKNDAAGRHLPVEHWGEALNHGRAAGATLAGEPDPWAAVPGFWSEISDRALKQVAWGDGFDAAEFAEHEDGAFTVRYFSDGEMVGALTHGRDEDYEQARAELEGSAELEAGAQVDRAGERESSGS